MSEGTSTVRTTKASMMMAAAKPMPNSLMTKALLTKPKERNTRIMMSPAAVMTRPVSAWPRVTARWLSLLMAHSSCIRLTRNTS